MNGFGSERACEMGPPKRVGPPETEPLRTGRLGSCPTWIDTPGAGEDGSRPRETEASITLSANGLKGASCERRPTNESQVLSLGLRTYASVL
jgi:hypothetical protein